MLSLCAPIGHGANGVVYSSAAKGIPHSKPKLWEAVRILQLKVFPEGEGDVDIDTRVDVELRNLRALYTCGEAKTVIGKLELQKQRLRRI